MEKLRAKKGFIIDMDGVVYHGNYLLPGALEFNHLPGRERNGICFDDNPGASPGAISAGTYGKNGELFYTSALATAPAGVGGSVYAIGERNALYVLDL